MCKVLYNDDTLLENIRHFQDLMRTDKVFSNSEKWYEMSREEQMITNMKKYHRLAEIDKVKYFYNHKPSYFYESS
jgi:hypothetical protein